MPAGQLIQLGSELYVDPRTITKVYKTEPFEVCGMTVLGHVYVSTGNVTRTSDWPFDRVRTALGLTDRTWIHEFWEAAGTNPALSGAWMSLPSIPYDAVSFVGND